MAVLERTLAAAAEASVLTIADAKRGDIGSTMAAYADAWLRDGSALAADSVTLSPYLGFESLRPALDLAAETGRGVFVLALTSNPEGASVQHVGGADSVARRISGRPRRRTSAMPVRSAPWAWWSAPRWAPPSPTWTWTSRRCAGRSWPRASARRAPRPRTCAARSVRLRPGPRDLQPGHPRRRTAAPGPPGRRAAHPRGTPRGLAAAASPARDRSCRTRAAGLSRSGLRFSRSRHWPARRFPLISAAARR